MSQTAEPTGTTSRCRSIHPALRPILFDEAILRIVRGAMDDRVVAAMGMRRSGRGIDVSGRSRRLRETVVHRMA